MKAKRKKTTPKKKLTYKFRNGGLKSLVTTRCIRCLYQATIYAGHLRKGRNQIHVLAGWCLECDANKPPVRLNLMGRAGCYGAWHRVYGLKVEHY